MEGLSKYIPLNFALMANPYNWIVVTLMVLIAGMALAAIFPTSNPGAKTP